MTSAVRTALVTGSTSGIGLAIAKRLAKAGYGIIAHGPDSEAAAAGSLDEIVACQPASFSYQQADLREPDEIEQMMERLAKASAPDILVNNAGIQHVAPIVDFPREAWDRIIAVDLSASFHTIRLALPGMRNRNWGRIINIASVSGLVGTPGKVPYVTAKHGLIGMTKAVALETATEPITCNAICPGWVLTPLVERQIERMRASEELTFEEASARLLKAKQPSGAFVRAEDVAATVEFLCSPAADQVRGAAWVIDGGYVAA